MSNKPTRAAEIDPPVRTKASYGIGGMCDAIKATTQGLYLLFFYTTVLGLPGRLVGVAAMLGLIWDSAIDPFIGRRSDRTTGRLGRRHGWMIVGIAGMGIGFIGLFNPPAGLSNTALFGWLLATSLLLRTGQSMFGVPYLALGAELDTTYLGRTSIAGYRVVAAQVGAMAASSLALALFFGAPTGTGSRLDASSYSRMSVAMGLLLCVAGVTAVLGTWRHRRDPSIADTPARAPSWRPIVRNRTFVILTCSASMFFLAAVIATVLSLYFLTHYAGIHQGLLLGLCQLGLHVGAIAGVVGWTRRASSHDKQYLYFVACLLAGVPTLLQFWLARLGGSAEALRYPLILLGHVVVGVGVGGVAVLGASMLADVAEEAELSVGERCEGAFFGAFSAGQQISTGVGIAVAGLLLDVYAGLVPGAATQPEQTVTRLGVLASLLPGTLMLTAGLLILKYSLSRARVGAIQHALAARRGIAAAEESSLTCRASCGDAVTRASR